MIKSFRLQLTAWYLLFFTLLFVLFSIFLYQVLARALHKRMDETLSSEANTAIGLFGAEMAELKEDGHAAAAEAMSEIKIRGVLVAVLQDGQLLASTAPFNNAELSAIAARAAAAHDEEILTGVAHYGPSAGRAVARRFILGGRQYVLIAVGSLDAVTADLGVVKNVIYVALPLAVLLAGIGGFILATKTGPSAGWQTRPERLQTKTFTAGSTLGQPLTSCSSCRSPSMNCCSAWIALLKRCGDLSPMLHMSSVPPSQLSGVRLMSRSIKNADPRNTGIRSPLFRMRHGGCPV